MLILRRPLFLLLAGHLLAATAGTALADPTTATQRPDLDALLECRSDVAHFAALVGPVDDPLKAVALGWAPQPRGNPFMAEYRLNTRAQAYGYHSDWLAISGGTVMLVIDQQQASPQALASALELEVVVDEDGKFMAGRELVSRDRPDPDSGQMLIESAVLGVSTVDSHPGKLLLGCTYSLDVPEEDEMQQPGPDAGTDADEAATSGHSDNATG